MKGQDCSSFSSINRANNNIVDLQLHKLSANYPFQYLGVNRCFYSLIMDFAFHNAFHHGYSYLPKLKPEFKVGHRAGFADTQTTIKGWMLEEVQVMKNS